MIISLDDLASIRERHLGQKIALTSGTFDLLHVGHLDYLEKVKQHGEIVVVLLSGDARVKARKGPSRPIISERERARILDSLKVVDYVFIDPSKRMQFGLNSSSKVEDIRRLILQTNWKLPQKNLSFPQTLQ